MTSAAPVAPPKIKLSSGYFLDQIGLGTWPLTDDEARDAVAHALRSGYRSIDTAARYGNETGVGAGIRESGVDRADVFLTTKLRNGQHGFDNTLRNVDESLKRLGTDYLDLYLIHWPMPRLDQYIDTWRAFVQLQSEGRVRSIGVSNFLPEHLLRLQAETGVLPAVNQIELHPDFSQPDMRRWHAEQGIVIESWSPLGRGDNLKQGVIVDLAKRYRREPAQIVLRWHTQLGLVAIPKSKTPARIEQNLNIFDFTLTDDDMAAIATLDGSNRMGGDPMTWEQV